MKKKTTQVLSDFFGDDIEGFALIIITVLQFMLSQKKHKKRFKEILKITLPDFSLDDFREIVSEQKTLYEKQKDEKPFLISNKIETSGKVISTLTDSPIRWLFISIYWAYNFRDNSIKVIQNKYDPRIGDIALIFILQSNQMKKMEMTKGAYPHSEKFYTNLATRLVKVTEILVAMSDKKNTYIDRVYLNDKTHDIASNFLHVLSENRFEKNTIDISKTKNGKSVIRYKNTIENIELFIASTRILQDGFLSHISRTYNEYQQLLYLNPNGSSGMSKRITTRGKKLPRNYDLIPDELIPIVLLDTSGVLNAEEKIEILNKRQYRRDSGIYNDKKNNSKHTPSAREKHQRNLAFSSLVAKDSIFLENDYYIPRTSLLSSFIKKIVRDDKNEASKFNKSLFVLSCVMGSKTEDILSMVSKKKNTTIAIKNNIITVKIDPNLFAKDSSSELLEDNKHTLTFEIPKRMSMIIATMSKEHDQVLYETRQNRFYTIKFKTSKLCAIIPVSNEKFISEYFYPSEEKILLSSYKKYVKINVKEFKRRIVIKTSKTHRFLPHFIHTMGGDIRTAKLATAVYTRNDQSKLAYTSTPKIATQHSQYVKQFWNVLECDKVSRDLINLPDGIFKTTVQPPFSTPENTGSSRSGQQGDTQHFFKILLENIDSTENKNDQFNLISIYVRYSMSILLGTRESTNSADFSSFSTRQALISINEKSQTIAMGVRYIPVCVTIQKILASYQILLKEKSLEKNVYLSIKGKYKIYTPSDAVHVIDTITQLINRNDLKKYVAEVPTNTGRHIFSKKALDFKIKDDYINGFLGHYAKGEEQLGIWSTLHMQDYHQTITCATTTIANIYGIKDFTW